MNNKTFTAILFFCLALPLVCGCPFGGHEVKGGGDCPVCVGTGHIGGICATCNGSGQAPMTRGATNPVVCNACGGTGSVAMLCQSCGGTGQKWQYETNTEEQ